MTIKTLRDVAMFRVAGSAIKRGVYAGEFLELLKLSRMACGAGSGDVAS